MDDRLPCIHANASPLSKPEQLSTGVPACPVCAARQAYDATMGQQQWTEAVRILGHAFREALGQQGCQAQVSNFDLPAVTVDVDLQSSVVL